MLANVVIDLHIGHSVANEPEGIGGYAVLAVVADHFIRECFPMIFLIIQPVPEGNATIVFPQALQPLSVQMHPLTQITALIAANLIKKASVIQAILRQFIESCFYKSFDLWVVVVYCQIPLSIEFRMFLKVFLKPGHF